MSVNRMPEAARSIAASTTAGGLGICRPARDSSHHRPRPRKIVITLRTRRVGTLRRPSETASSVATIVALGSADTRVLLRPDRAGCRPAGRRDRGWSMARSAAIAPRAPCRSAASPLRTCSSAPVRHCREIASRRAGSTGSRSVPTSPARTISSGSITSAAMPSARPTAEASAVASSRARGSCAVRASARWSSPASSPATCCQASITAHLEAMVSRQPRRPHRHSRGARGVVGDHVPDLPGQQMGAAQGGACTEHRSPDPGGESEEDDVPIRLTGETRFVEGGEADVVVHQHGAAELVREQLSDEPRLDQLERLHRGLGGGESVPAGGVRARQADPDPGEELEMDLAHGQVPDGLQRQPDTRFPARALDVIGHAGGDHLSGRIRQAERGGGVAEVDADVAHRARMDAEHLRRTAAATR